MIIFDSHIHLVQCDSLPVFKETPVTVKKYFAASCTFSLKEFSLQEKISVLHAKNAAGRIFNFFGVHPQNPQIENILILEKLLEQKKLDGIGECGFDFFTEEFRKMENQQEECWNAQIELAQKFSLPLVIHGRKCTDKFFRDIKKLKKISAVVFHSWAGTYREALSLDLRGVNCFFSFGKPLLNGKKSALECVQKLPLNKILLETDAPYQTLKGEEKTFPSQIIDVYDFVARLRKIPLEEFGEQIFCSMNSIFRH